VCARRLPFLLLLLPAAAAALETDPQAPVHITADQVVIEEKTGISRFTGSVRMTQGSLTVEGDSVVLYAEPPRGKVRRIVVTGRPARFRQRPGPGAAFVDGQARRMVYETASARLLLEGAARLVQGPNEFSGERIEYDTRRSVVTASGGEGGPRVRTIIQPEGTGP